MKLFALLTKDVKAENETKRVMVALRVLYIAVLAAFIINLFLAGPRLVDLCWRRIFALMAANIALLVHTYYAKTKTALRLFMLFLFLFSILCIPMFGWSAGFQNYFILILLLVFFGSYDRSLYKFVYSMIVLCARIVVILIFGKISPMVEIRLAADKALQIVNISAVFMAIIYISYTFSKTENEAEGKLVKYNDRLQKEANTDQLTGLYNRRKAKEYLSGLIAENNGSPISIAIGDIDFFKKVNDTYGHDAGDEVLKAVAALMMEDLRSSSFIARWGGEEFLIIFPDCNGDQANVALERLRRAVEANVIRVKDDEIRITMTFGLAEYDFGGDMDASVKEADEKLYQGKENGRNQVVY